MLTSAVCYGAQENKTSSNVSVAASMLESLMQ